MLKAVLCDLDGTLLDSNSFHAESWQRSFSAFGYPVSFEDVVKQIGKGGEYLLERFVPKSELPLIEKDINAFRKRLFHREYIDRIVPFADARRLLERMRQEGLRIAVATSSASSRRSVGLPKRTAAASLPTVRCTWFPPISCILAI